MAVSRFNSQIRPEDSTEKIGYKFFPAAPGGVLSNATAVAMNSGVPVISFTSTSPGYVQTPAELVPNDIDTAYSAYATLVYGSISTATDATAVFTAAYDTFTTGGTAVAQADAAIAAFTVTLAATTGYVTASSSAAMAATPTPGDLISWKISCDPLTVSTAVVVGVKMEYTRRFL